MRLDRWFKRRFPALVAVASRQDLPQGRGSGRRQARRDLDAARTGPDDPHPAAQSGCGALGRRPASSANPDDARDIARDDAVRGQGRAGAQQALRPRRAGRLGHDAPYRRDAGVARQGRQQARCWCIGSTATLAACCWSPRTAAPPRSSARRFARDRRRKSIGRWSRACPSPRRGAFRFISPRARAWATTASPRKPGAGSTRDLEKMRVARHGEAEAQHSLTYYAIVDKAAPRCAWLSMKPLTGRTHQLRAHAEAIGHPIFGDPKYGHRPEDEVRRRDPLRALPEGRRAQAASFGAPAGAAASQGRDHRRDRPASRRTCARPGTFFGFDEKQIRSDRGRAGGVTRA